MSAHLWGWDGVGHVRAQLPCSNGLCVHLLAFASSFPAVLDILTNFCTAGPSNIHQTCRNIQKNIKVSQFWGHATNLSVPVDVPPEPALVLFSLAIAFRHLHLTQVYSLSPGVDFTSPYRKRPREQRGIWWGQATARGLPGAQVRKRDGAETPARGSRARPAFGLFHLVVCVPPASTGSSRGCWCSRVWLCVCFMCLHSVACGCALLFRVTAASKNHRNSLIRPSSHECWHHFMTKDTIFLLVT